MANTTKTTNTKTIITLENLNRYDDKLKAKMAADDAAALKSAKDYADGLAGNYDPKGTAETKVNELASGAVKTNTDAITKLNGDDTVEGSVSKKIKDAAAALKEEISASAYDDTEIKGRVSANETAIASLIGTGEGSVDKKVADAVAAIVANAPESYDTLKEISDWISTHSSDAASMNSQINANKADIDALKSLVTQLPEGTEATTIVEYISEKIGTLKIELTTSIADAKTEAIAAAGTNTDTKITAKIGDIGESTVKTYVDTAKSDVITSTAADATAKADKALSDAKAYTDTVADRVTELEKNPTYVEATDEEIDSLFPSLPVEAE